MRVLIKNARVVQGGRVSDPQNLLIENGVIQRIGRDIQATGDVQIIESRHLHVSPGWFDLGTQVCDPGLEQREDVHTALMAAAAGGFTAVAPFPNTYPAVHGKAEILYWRHKAEGNPVALYPVGAVSVGTIGKDLAELYDMFASGAIAFSDGPGGIQDTGLMLRALLYVQSFGGLVIDQPMDKWLAQGGQMHEGVVSTGMGVRGIPSLAEVLAVQRDLSLLEYTGGRLHLYGLSTSESVEMVRQAKRRGLAVTASTPVLNVCFTDVEMSAFESDWKVLPPLRADSDRIALLEGIADGTLDCLTSNHVPWNEEGKNLEFTYAEFGMSGLQTALPLTCHHLLKALSVADVVRCWAEAPRRILGLPVPVIAEGANADLTAFDPGVEWTPQVSVWRSKGLNTPLMGAPLQGSVLCTITGQNMLSP